MPVSEYTRSVRVARETLRSSGVRFEKRRGLTVNGVRISEMREVARIADQALRGSVLRFQRSEEARSPRPEDSAGRQAISENQPRSSPAVLDDDQSHDSQLHHSSRVGPGADAEGFGTPNVEPPPYERARFTNEGEIWQISFAGRTKSYRANVGLQRLHILLSKQGKEVRVEELVGAEDLDRGEPASDGQALEEIRKQEEELRQLIESGGDPAQVAIAREDLEKVQSHLASQIGLSGRSRRMGDDAALAASAAGHSIRRAIQKLRGGLPELATHLDEALVGPAGRFPAYRPSTKVDWEL